jgi:uncharacterized protein YjgD (DUF1641 family)
MKKKDVKDKRLDVLTEELSKPENVKALQEIVDRLPNISYAVNLLDEMVNNGTLDTLARLACMANSLKGMLSDEMISGASSLASSAIDVLAKTKSPVTQNLISAIADHPIEFQRELERTKVTGLLSLLSMLRDKDVQEGLSVLFTVLKMVGRYGYEKKE